ncbi:hypothetical protein JVU11DRAFT_5930 [Chiua virens]|nr:hypothetical protein JVU11DRAFT_5930 [Chiua virens]
MTPLACGSSLTADSSLLPRSSYSLTYIDLERGRDWRLNVSASDIDTSGFTLHIETWGNTLLHGVTACWIAYPEDRPHIFSTSVNTMEIRPVTQPQHQQSKQITFDPATFWTTPSVFVALNYLNVDCTRNLRVKAYVDGASVSGTGLPYRFLVRYHPLCRWRKHHRFQLESCAAYWYVTPLLTL